MSADLDIYDAASRHGWKLARPWWDPQTDIFGRGVVIIVVCWRTDDTVTCAYSFSTDATGVQREFPNPGDTDGLVAVSRWLREEPPR